MKVSTKNLSDIKVCLYSIFTSISKKLNYIEQIDTHRKYSQLNL